MNWIMSDITWCYNECDNMKCYRNVKHLNGHEGRFSMGMLKDTCYCPSYEEDEECSKEDQTGK